MVGALLSFSVMAVSIRELSRGGMSIFEILAIRSGVALLVLLVLLALRPELRLLTRPHRLGLHAFDQGGDAIAVAIGAWKSHDDDSHGKTSTVQSSITGFRNSLSAMASTKARQEAASPASTSSSMSFCTRTLLAALNPRVCSAPCTAAP